MERGHAERGAVARLSEILAQLGGALVLLCAFAISFDVLTRNVLGATYLESFELGRYAFAIAVTFGLAYALMHNTHIRIDVLYKYMPKSLRSGMDVLAAASMALLALLMTYYGYELVSQSLEHGMRSSTSLRVYLWIPQGLWLLGLAWFSVAAVWLLWRRVVPYIVRGSALIAKRLPGRERRA